MVIYGIIFIRKSMGGFVMSFLLFLVFISSIITIFKPRMAWNLSTGWKFKGAEPSDSALVFHSTSGVVVAIITVVILFNNISSGQSSNNWPHKFIERATVENIERITVFGGREFSAEEIERFTENINKVQMTKVPSQNSMGYITSITIAFKDGTIESIYNTGLNFIITPSGMDNGYIFNSPELEELIGAKNN